jgi:hypothetical protein
MRLQATNLTGVFSRRPSLAWRSLLLALCLTGGSALAAATVAAHVAPERLPGSGDSKAPQFVQADATGHVFLLRTDPLAVVPLTSTGTLGEPVPLDRLPTGQEHAFIRDAALAPDGGSWLLLDIAQGPRLFRDGKEQPGPELGWRVTAVALPRGEPWAAVLPMPRHGLRLIKRPEGQVTMDAQESPPLVMRLADSGWASVVREDYDFASTDWREARGRLQLSRDARLAPDPAGGVWLAEEYGYRLRRFSPAGKVRAEVTVGPGRPVLMQRSPAEIAKQLASAEASAGHKLDPGSARFSATHQVEGLAVARDGRVYVLAEAAGEGNGPHLALDRFDPSGPTVERVLLDRIAAHGRASIALGRDGLYIAKFSGEEGLWRLRWDQLDEAKWQRLGNARLDGDLLAAE